MGLNCPKVLPLRVTFYHVLFLGLFVISLMVMFTGQCCNVQVLELPYKGREISLLILLPADMEDDSTGLEKVGTVQGLGLRTKLPNRVRFMVSVSQLEKELTYDNFMNWTSPDSLSTYDVEVGLPRFKMEDTYDMKDVLVSMGMKDAFDANLSDLSGKTYRIFGPQQPRCQDQYNHHIITSISVLEKCSYLTKYLYISQGSCYYF